MNDQQSKVAVVTGAGGTLCSEMARVLAGKGIKTALLGRDIAKLQKTEAEIKADGGVAISVSCDVTDMKSVENARDVILAELGVPTILINGAGGNQSDAITTINEFDERELGGEPQVRGFFNVDMDIFRSVIETNTMGTVIPCRVFGAEMAKAGGGSIINFASMTGFRQCSRVGAYGIAKAGIINFTSWLAAYLAPAGIRVNAIAPGFFLNDRSRKLLLKPEGGFSERGANIIRQTPMKRFGEASELIGCMNWLIDDDASGFVTGVTIPVDGGFLSCAGV